MVILKDCSIKKCIEALFVFFFFLSKQSEVSKIH